MSNGEVCCILGVCCPPAAARKKVTAMLASEHGLEIATAEAVFDWFDSRVDFAPKDSLASLRESYVSLTRHHDAQKESD